MDKKIIFRKVERKDLDKVFPLLQQLTKIDYSSRDKSECWDSFISNTSSNSIVGIYDNEIFSVENIHYYKGDNIERYDYEQKLSILRNIFETKLQYNRK